MFGNSVYVLMFSFARAQHAEWHVDINCEYGPADLQDLRESLLNLVSDFEAKRPLAGFHHGPRLALVRELGFRRWYSLVDKCGTF